MNILRTLPVAVLLLAAAATATPVTAKDRPMPPPIGAPGR